MSERNIDELRSTLHEYGVSGSDCQRVVNALVLLRGVDLAALEHALPFMSGWEADVVARVVECAKGVQK